MKPMKKGNRCDAAFLPSQDGDPRLILIESKNSITSPFTRNAFFVAMGDFLYQVSRDPASLQHSHTPKNVPRFDQSAQIWSSVIISQYFEAIGKPVDSPLPTPAGKKCVDQNQREPNRTNWPTIDVTVTALLVLGVHRRDAHVLSHHIASIRAQARIRRIHGFWLRITQVNSANLAGIKTHREYTAIDG